MKSVLITPEGIQKNLKNIKPLDAICEYIWNGFDAFATQVEVELHRNKMGLINMITIRDNGCGINYDELKYKFQPFNDSKKAWEKRDWSSDIFCIFSDGKVGYCISKRWGYI